MCSATGCASFREKTKRKTGFSGRAREGRSLGLLFLPRSDEHLRWLLMTGVTQFTPFVLLPTRKVVRLLVRRKNILELTCLAFLAAPILVFFFLFCFLSK